MKDWLLTEKQKCLWWTQSTKEGRMRRGDDCNSIRAVLLCSWMIVYPNSRLREKGNPMKRILKAYSKHSIEGHSQNFQFQWSNSLTKEDPIKIKFNSNSANSNSRYSWRNNRLLWTRSNWEDRITQTEKDYYSNWVMKRKRRSYHPCWMKWDSEDPMKITINYQLFRISLVAFVNELSPVENTSNLGRSGDYLNSISTWKREWTQFRERILSESQCRELRKIN